MTDERVLETGSDEPLTEDDLRLEAVELPERQALSIVAPSGVAGPQLIPPIGAVPYADAETVAGSGTDGDAGSYTRPGGVPTE